MKEAQLSLPQSQSPAITQSPSIAQLLQGVVERGVTAENAEALTTLCALYERVEAKNAERAFNAAFVKLQGEMPNIVASSVIPNRGKYERFEDVMRQIGPQLQANGFAVSFDQKPEENRVTVICNLRHIDGHSSQTSFTVRLGGRADSDTQADCKASTTAKRNALLQALNIVIRQDIYQSDEADVTVADGGGVVTANQAADLQALCEETGSDKVKFLAFAGAATFSEISASRFEELAKMLNKKRK
jgi:hypothetical protein